MKNGLSTCLFKPISNADLHTPSGKIIGISPKFVCVLTKTVSQAKIKISFTLPSDCILK